MLSDPQRSSEDRYLLSIFQHQAKRKKSSNDSRSSQASTAMYRNPFEFHQFVQQQPYFFIIFRHAAVRPLRVMNMRVLAIGYQHLRDSDCALLSLFSFPIQRVIEASNLAVFDDIAQHHHTLYLIFTQHLLKLILGVFQRALSNDHSPALRKRDPVGVDVSFSLTLLDSYSTMLVYITNKQHMDCQGYRFFLFSIMEFTLNFNLCFLVQVKARNSQNSLSRSLLAISSATAEMKNGRQIRERSLHFQKCWWKSQFFSNQISHSPLIYYYDSESKASFMDRTPRRVQARSAIKGFHGKMGRRDHNLPHR